MSHAGTVATKNPEADLNEAAEQGWEVFDIVAFPHSGGVSVRHYLRRPKEEGRRVETGSAEMPR